MKRNREPGRVGLRRQAGALVARAIWSGSAASLASACVLAWRGRREAGSAAAPINAVSHWYHGDRALRRDTPSARYTLPGVLTHHAASILWATVFECWVSTPKWRNAPPGLPAAGTAALAAFVDYTLTPRRFTPGFEKRLSLWSLALVYGAFATGLVAAARSRESGLPREGTTTLGDFNALVLRNRRGFTARRPDRLSVDG